MIGFVQTVAGTIEDIEFGKISLWRYHIHGSALRFLICLCNCCYIVFSSYFLWSRVLNLSWLWTLRVYGTICHSNSIHLILVVWGAFFLYISSIIIHRYPIPDQEAWGYDVKKWHAAYTSIHKVLSFIHLPYLCGDRIDILYRLLNLEIPRV